MPTQSIDLSAVTGTTFGGTAVDAINLNGTEIWSSGFNLAITSNVNNYDIGAAVIAAGSDKATPVTLTIAAGVTVSSTSTATPAMFTGTGWSSGTSITIINNGSILGLAGSYSDGAGGNGGGDHSTNRTGDNGFAGTTGGGLPGGPCFEHSQTADTNLSVIFTTVGIRAGGAGGTGYGVGSGGGGGQGAGAWQTPGQYSSGPDAGGGGGGGGAGSPGGTGGRYFGSVPGSSFGGTGGATSGGAGGYSGGVPNAGYSTGGNGGGTGSAGGTGGASSHPNWNHGTPGVGGAGSASQTSTGASGATLTGNTAQIS